MSDNLKEDKTDPSPEGWECDACGADVSFEDAFCKGCGADITEANDAEGNTQEKDAFTAIERNSIAACCGLALLLFFFPLLTIHVPIAGDQEVSGYDVFSKLTEFREKLKRSNASSSSEPYTANPNHPIPDLPLSIKLGWLMPLALVIAFVSAAIALIAAFKDIRTTRIACAIGAFCSAAAILHVTIMNSDIHSWLSESMKMAREDLRGNPFAGLADNLSALIVNAFQIKPGWGVYVLLVLLGLAAIFGFTRILSRLRVVPISES